MQLLLEVPNMSCYVYEQSNTEVGSDLSVLMLLKQTKMENFWFQPHTRPKNVKKNYLHLSGRVRSEAS